MRTLLVGSSEVVLDCLYHIGLDVFLLLEGEGSAVHELSVLVVGEASSGGWF